jgi:hypothetical protein
MTNRIVGLDGRPTEPDPEPQRVGATVRIRKTVEGEPWDAAFEIELLMPSGDSWIRVASVLQSIAVRLQGGVTIKEPQAKIRIFCQQAFGPALAGMVEELVGSVGAQGWRSFVARDGGADPPPTTSQDSASPTPPSEPGPATA